ncbi:MAG: hypothetical protein ACTSU5_13070 [Promethearchaeota archaeon]
MENYTRAELAGHKATANQLRNTVYHVIRKMRAHYGVPVPDRLREMGRRIAETYSEFWNPRERDMQRLLKEIYATVFASKVRIDYDKAGGVVRVTDKKCALCKYRKEDLDEAGCEVIVGFVERLVDKIRPVRGLSWALESVGVEKTPVRGDPACEHVYRVRRAS